MKQKNLKIKKEEPKKYAIYDEGRGEFFQDTYNNIGEIEEALENEFGPDISDVKDGIVIWELKPTKLTIETSFKVVEELEEF